MKVLSKLKYLLLFSVLASCNLLRTVGLYNTPTNYSESFEEFNERKFIKHSNKKENLIINLTPKKNEFSPYEKIELILSIYNISSDTMYLYKPGLSGSSLSYKELFIYDSLYRKVNIIEYELNIDYIIDYDEYGRRVSPTLAPYNYKLSPNDSLIKIIEFRTGKRICYISDPVDEKMNKIRCRASTYYRENIPGIYSGFYIHGHEEYDEVMGPIYVKIQTPEIKYKVRNYSEEEEIIREKVYEIISAVEYNGDSIKIDSLCTIINDEYPNNIYKEQTEEYIKSYYSIKLSE